MRVLICAPIVPEHDRESGSRRLCDLIDLFRAADADVSFVARDAKADSRYLRELRQRGVATWRGDDPRLPVLLARGRFDVALLMFWYVAETYLPILRSESPLTRIIVDTVDLHFLRVSRERFVHAGNHPPVDILDGSFASELARELNAYAAADAVLTVSDKEAGLINDLLARPGHARAVADLESLAPTPRRFGQRSGVLFVGNFRHPPNEDAVEWLCSEVAPRIDPTLLARHPISIVGTDPPAHIVDLTSRTPGMRPVGWVPSLVPWLDASRVCVAPLQWGAGTKRKLVQALMAGLPCVTTPMGAEGLGLEDGVHALIREDAAEFAAAVTQLLSDGRTWQRLRRAGRKHVTARHGPPRVRAQFDEALRDVLAAGPADDHDTDGDEVAPPIGAVSRWPDAAYRRLVSEVNDAVGRNVPEDVGVMVISRGDPRLVDHTGRPAMHFPYADEGGFAGWYPASDDEAIALAVRGQRRGAEFLVIPATASWWLDHYKALADWLATECNTVWADEWCRVIALPPDAEVSRRAG